MNKFIGTITLILFLGTTFLFSSCKKYDEDKNLLSLRKPESRLKNNRFQLEEIIQDEKSEEVTEHLSYSFLIEDGTNKLKTWTSTSTTTSNFPTWELTDDDEKLTITTGQKIETYTITRLSNKHLWMIKEENGKKIEYHFTKI